MDTQEKSKLFYVAVITITLDLSMILAIIIFASILNIQSENYTKDQEPTYKHPSSLTLQN